MANHYLVVGVAARDFERISALQSPVDDEVVEQFNFEGELLADEIDAMCLSAGCSTQLVVGCEIAEAQGDQIPKIIQLTTQWKHPEPYTLRDITEWLCAKFFLKAIVWVGHDPRDGSVKHLECAAGVTP